MCVSQGQGIIVTDNQKCILSHLTQHKKRFVIQKYIERPMLLYNTKFDIRSYFLVSIECKSITFWTSPVSSIKFASAEFTLDNLEEMIHITNAAVQQKYIQQQIPRDTRIPYHRMWSNDQFICYLQNQNMEHVWKERIYPSMKKSLVAIARATCDNIDKKYGRYALLIRTLVFMYRQEKKDRFNYDIMLFQSFFYRFFAVTTIHNTAILMLRFELFGCDWIVTADDYNVFLLEIQRPPGISFSS